MTVTHINKVEADKVYNELLAALGTEHNKSQWFEFVKAVKHWLPFVGKGRPTSEQINNSVIGQKGFSGWLVMVAAPLEDGGFNTPVNTWNKWSQAAEFIFMNPWLAELNLSQPGVKALREKFKGMDFPSSIKELEVAEVELKKQKANNAVEKLSSLKARILELEQQLIAVNAKLSVFAEQSKQLEEQNQKIIALEVENRFMKKQVEEIPKLEEKLDSSKVANERMSKALIKEKEELKKSQSIGRFAHLVKFITG